MMSVRRVGVVLVLLPAVCCALAGSAAASPRQPASYAPSFAPIAGTGVLGDGGDVLITNGTGGGTGIVDGLSPYQISMPPDCTTWSDPTPMLQRGVLFFDDCGSSQTSEILRMGTRRGWQPVPSAQINQLCSAYSDPLGQCSPVAVGGKWIQYRVQCYHCEVIHDLVSTTTGAIRHDPTDGRVIADLSAADPRRLRCRGVSVRPGGSVQFVGDLALVTSANIGDFAAYAIKRCGATHALRLGNPELLGTQRAQVATNKSLIIWPGALGTDALDGIQAHTHRRFTIKLPQAIPPDALEGTALSSTTLYLADATDQTVLAAKLPLALR